MYLLCVYLVTIMYHFGKELSRLFCKKFLKDEKKRMNPQILYLLRKTRYNGVCLQGA